MMSLPPCRVIVDDVPQAGTWNMAVDEALLESALERDACTVRVYAWREATVSLGYFQKADEAGPALENLPTVRRLTGGGAILHHHEWTYSCALPASHPLVAVPYELYGRVHDNVIALLAEFGINAALRGSPRTLESEPFLCFGRGDAKDVVLGPHKILGSAQRRRRGAVLQHGSLLLSQSPFAPEFPGILELAPRTALPPDFPKRLAKAVAAALANETRVAPLDALETRRAEDLERERYRRLDWHRRTIAGANET